MGTRVKTFDATGLAPGGKLYAGDLNSIQDQYADLVNYAQSVGVGILAIGEAGLQLLRYGTGEARISGKLRTDGLIRALGGLMVATYTTSARDAIASGSRPQGMIIFNSTTGQLEYNAGSDATPAWKPVAFDTANLLKNPTGTPGGLIPSGAMMPFGGAAAPSGFLLCDGASYLRTDYTNLFNALGGAGSPWGLPDGTHFNVPNFKGRVPAGRDAAQVEFDTLGEYGGEKAHVLTVAELASHLHGNGDLTARAYSQGNTSASGNATRLSNLSSSGDDSGAVTGQTSSAGSGASHNNLQPYGVVNYIIKT